MLTPIEQRDETPFPSSKKKIKPHNHTFLPCWSSWFIWFFAQWHLEKADHQGHKQEPSYCLQLQQLMKQYFLQVWWQFPSLFFNYYSLVLHTSELLPSTQHWKACYQRGSCHISSLLLRTKNSPKGPAYISTVNQVYNQFMKRLTINIFCAHT